MRLHDEIMEGGVSLRNSPNLRDLMEEQDQDEIRPVAERPRQTMGSILSISSHEVGGKTLWEVIQEEEESKPEEEEARILKNALRFRFRREDSEIREKETEQRESELEAAAVDEEIGLLESWGAAERSPHSPAVVDSTRLHLQDSRLTRLESEAVRVYLVGGSNPSSDQSMDGINRRWRALKHRIRLRKFACCGSNWSSAAAGAERSSFSNASSTSVMLPREEEVDDEEDEISNWNGGAGAGGEIDPPPDQNPSNNTISTSTNATDTGLENDENSVETCVNALVTADRGAEERSVEEPRRQQLITLFGRNFEQTVEAEDGAEIHVGMNLAAALAAERQLRAAQEWDITTRNTSTSTTTSTSSPGVSISGQPPRGTSPFRVSLMSLLEESDDRAAATARSKALFSEEWDSKEAGAIGDDPLCCVCMVRRKGAAFIPCGHTFCRICTRELWVSRGSCPLCNRYIMEILDIF